MEKTQEQQLAMWCHLSTFAGYFVPFGNLLGPLLIMALKKGESPLVDRQAKEALNFQITVTIATIASVVLILALVGILLLPVVLVLDLVFVVVAAIKANEGREYRYPLTIRFIK
jgi:hypothetical protein